MHTYEAEGRDKAVMAQLVASALLVWVMHASMGAIGFEPPWWASAPSWLGCYSGLRWWFDRFLWRLRVFRLLKFVDVPDLNGRWVGQVDSSYDERGRTWLITVTILQRWSKMSVTLETERSRSRSSTANLRTRDCPHPELTYQYMSDPRSNAPDTMAIHRGTATLELIDGDLAGDYYTGRGRREFGTITLQRS